MWIGKANAPSHYLAKRLFLLLSIAVLASCRLVITTDGTGYITSDSGAHDCHQDSCAITIEGEFRETFTAIPADGYRLVGWDGVCVYSATNRCELQLNVLPAEYSKYDGDVPLSAVFESDSVKRAWYRDKDSDNYGAPDKRKMAYVQPAGFVINNLDCDDQQGDVHPRAKERADGLDNNCSGAADDRSDGASCDPTIVGFTAAWGCSSTGSLAPGFALALVGLLAGVGRRCA